MRVLMLHNLYQQPGGEDVVVEQERVLLESQGHEVQLLTESNERIGGLGAYISTACNSIYSRSSGRTISKTIAEFRPDIIHVHNFFPLISPSAYFACERAGVPVVQTLHNFRIICPGATLFRSGHVCEDCLGRQVPWPGVRHKCYRENFLGSAAVATMISIHRGTGTWANKVSGYIALTRFARHKFISGGLPPAKLFIKPNFLLEDPGLGARDGNFALFVGRLSPEKGVRTLISAWKSLPDKYFLKIVGSGPLERELRSIAGEHSNMEFLGRLPRESVYALMDHAQFLVVPSEWYESFPVVVAEAFARGLPVIASNIGSLAELIDDGRTGFLFQPGNADELAFSVHRAFEHKDEMDSISQSARMEFQSKYTAQRNYESLMQIYSTVLQSKN